MRLGGLAVIAGFVLLGWAHYMGLFVAPSEAYMQNVGRILYVHVPTAWVSLLCFLVSFIAAVGALWTGRYGWDALVAASSEVGVVLTALLLCQGAIWAKPTWGTWWSWDPRLTSSAMMLVMFGVVLLLRALIRDPARRLTVSSIAAVLAFVDVPIVYFSVKWWNTLHQPLSSPETVSQTMHLPLRMAAFGMLFLAAGLIGIRALTIRRELIRETTAPELPTPVSTLALDGEGGA